MPIIAESWSVVVVGFWNRAIFTPAWIGQNLFGLGPDTPMQIMIPMDVPGPWKVIYQDLTVTVTRDRVIIEPTRSNFDGIMAASLIGRKALDELPRTPVVAAGLNLRYKSTDSVRALDRITASEWDGRLADNGLAIEGWTVARSLRLGSGRINVTITREGDAVFTVELNFHLQSNDRDLLKNWLSVSKDDLQGQVERIINRTVGIRPEEVIYA
jgi:hypothetical protein